MKFHLYSSGLDLPSFTLNGIKMTNNYFDNQNGIKIFYSIGNIIFSTKFGLTIKWNGIHKAKILLCDFYSNYVCGLCGNADGIKENDKRDRKNNYDHQWFDDWRIINENISRNTNDK